MQPQIIIGKFLSALKAGDVEAATDFVAENAAFVGVRPDPKPSVPPYGTYIGRDGLEAFFSALARTFSKQSLTVEHVGEGENVAFASGRLDHVVAATGKPFSCDWVLRCRVRNGQITHYQFCEDSARLEEALSPDTETA